MRVPVEGTFFSGLYNGPQMFAFEYPCRSFDTVHRLFPIRF